MMERIFGSQDNEGRRGQVCIPWQGTMLTLANSSSISISHILETKVIKILFWSVIQLWYM